MPDRWYWPMLGHKFIMQWFLGVPSKKINSIFKDIVQIGGREVNMINTLSKINLSKIGWEGGRSTSIWIMSVNILGFFWTAPLS